MTTDDLNAIIEAGNIPEDMTPGAVYIVVCDLAARVKELEAVLGRVRGFAAELGQRYPQFSEPLLDIARELGKLLEGIE